MSAAKTTKKSSNDKAANQLQDYVPALRVLYNNEIIPLMLKRFKYANIMEVPRLKSISLNMGLGDAKLMAGIGFLFGWQSIPFVLFVSSILGLIFVIPSLIKKQKNMRTEIPFGPFIILACLIYFVYGSLIYDLILV